MLPVLAVLGPHLPIVSVPGVNLFGFRLAVIVLAILPLVLDPRIPWIQDGPIRYYALVGIVWIFWSALSGFWVANVSLAAVEMLAVTFGFLTALALVNLRAYTENRLRWLLRGWMAGAVVAAAIAIWELTIGHHLPGSWVSAVPSYATSFIAVSTFDNPNNYGAFLVLVTAVTLHLLQTTPSRAIRLAAFGFLLLSIVLCVLTTSKLAVGGVFVVLTVYFVRGVRHKLAAATLMLTIAVAVYAAWAYLSTNVPLLVELAGLRTRGLGDGGLERLNLIRAGLDMTVSTYGLGVGGGNYAYLMQGGFSRYMTHHMIDPHIWWIEVLSQYGVVVFTLYVGFFAYMIATAEVSCRRAARYKRDSISLFVIAFVLAGVENSSYIQQMTNWLFVATMLMMVSELRRTERQAGDRPDG